MSAAATAELKTKESVVRPALLLMCGRTLAFAVTFFIPVALVRLFDPAQFGTYKQLFLVFSTVYLISQLGMATSLYYFLPQSPRDAGRLAANSTLFLGSVGVFCMAIVSAAAPQVAHWLNNRELAGYLPWIGVYIFLMMISAPFEIVMIARKQYSLASAAYALSDLARAAALILPVLLFRQMGWLLRGAVFVAFLRATVTVVYFRREFGVSFVPDKTLLRKQLAYALPFAAAVLVEILQGSVPQYAVSSLFDPATFAIFAVGCLQIPLVDMAASPASDVMMVQMQEQLSEGRMSAVLEIWRETTGKLALLFFPLSFFAILASREIIVLLYTRKYLASVPIFAAWSAMIILSSFQVDGVMRVFAQTRFLLLLNLMRLAIIGGLIRWSLLVFGLPGPILTILLAMCAFRVAALIRMKGLIGTGFTGLLPWRSLVSILAAAGCAGLAAAGVRSLLHVPSGAALVAMALTYAATYCSLVWSFGLMGPDEKLALAGWARRRSTAIARSLDFAKG